VLTRGGCFHVDCHEFDITLRVSGWVWCGEVAWRRSSGRGGRKSAILMRLRHWALNRKTWPKAKRSHPRTLVGCRPERCGQRRQARFWRRCCRSTMSLHRCPPPPGPEHAWGRSLATPFPGDSPLGALSPLVDSVGDVADGGEDSSVLSDEILNFTVGVHHRSVIAVKLLANLR